MVKSVFLIFLAIKAILAVPDFQYDLSKADEYFDKFIKEYGKVYSSVEEKAKRFEIFKEWLKKCNQQNLENEFATFAINEYSDKSIDELKFRTSYKPMTSSMAYESCERLRAPPAHAPTENDFGFDWRSMNVVTPVKDQGMCGSCWAFSATGNIESQFAKKYGYQVLVSEQQLVDCDFADDACNGGQSIRAFKYLKSVGGAMLARDYPYEGSEGPCSYDPHSLKIKLKGCECYLVNNEYEAMTILRRRGPLSISIASESLLGYHGGIITKCSTYPINHEVLLVGYGKANGTWYWTMKNSWGTNHGELGYVRVQMGHGGCGFANNVIRSAVVA